MGDYISSSAKMISILTQNIDQQNATSQSMYKRIQRMSFDVAYRPIQLNKSGSQKVDLFMLNGGVFINNIGLMFEQVVNSTTLSGCKFVLNYGESDIDLCAATDLSGAVRGSFVFKSGDENQQLTFINLNAIGISSKSPLKFLLSGVIDEQAPTLIKFIYTGDEQTNVNVMFFVDYNVKDLGFVEPAPLPPPPQ